MQPRTDVQGGTQSLGKDEPGLRSSRVPQEVKPDVQEKVGAPAPELGLGSRQGLCPQHLWEAPQDVSR